MEKISEMRDALQIKATLYGVYKWEGRIVNDKNNQKQIAGI
jgi:hypothetical protein